MLALLNAKHIQPGRSLFNWGQTHREVGAESHGSLELRVAADLAEFLSEKDSRVAEYDIVKVIKGAARLFCLPMKCKSMVLTGCSR